MPLVCHTITNKNIIKKRIAILQCITFIQYSNEGGGKLTILALISNLATLATLQHHIAILYLSELLVKLAQLDQFRSEHQLRWKTY